MSVESMAIALHHSKATGVTRMVLLGIANHDGDGGAWPAMDTLAWYCGGVNRRTVQRAIKDLQALGELGETVLMGGGMRDTNDWERPNLYSFTLRCPANCDRTSQHRLCRECGDERRRSKKFVCPACAAAAKVTAAAGPAEAVDNPGQGGVVPRPPRGPQTTGGGGPQTTGGGGPQTTRTVPITTPGNSSPLSLNPPGAGTICWACGKPQAPPNARYCTSCSGLGLAQPWIDCDGGCGAVRKRIAPGQQTYTCKNCQHDHHHDQEQQP